MNLPKIGITLGDPGSIGPEIVLKAFSSKNTLPKAQYIIFGTRHVLEGERRKSGIKLNLQPFDTTLDPTSPTLSLLEVKCSLTAIKKGIPSRENGEASFRFFQEAYKLAETGAIQALVTGPISKESWDLAGIKWTGHTHFLSNTYPQVIMTFWSEKMKVALFSHHLPLKKTLEKIRREALLEFFLRLHKSLERIYHEKLQFLVAGLNPHAGESGLMGSEEEEEIVPAITEAQKQGLRISGPFPPDVVFRKGMNQPDKIVIALYHDQGLIPFKLIAFERGVNVTLGLPFIRTSPDHGTAFDIAGRGIANPLSMIEAIKIAHKLSSSNP